MKKQMFLIFAGLAALTITTSAFAAGKELKDPKSIQGLVWWLDAADAKSITKDAAGKVSKWGDKSGKGHDGVQGDPASQPQWNAQAINGQPAILFPGKENVNLKADPFDQKMVVAFVVGGRSQEVETPWERVDGQAEHRGFVCGNQTETYNCFPEYRINGAALTQPSEWGKTVAVVTGIKGEQSPANLVIGFGTPGYAPLNGPLAEVLAFDRTLTAEEIIAVEQYLMNKWKIKK